MSHSPELEFYKKRQFGEKLNATFVFIRENAWPYLKSQLLISGPVLLLISILMTQVSGDLMAFFTDPENINANAILDMLRIYGLVILSMIVTSTIIPSVTYGYMIQYKEKEPKSITIADVMKGFSARFFNLLGYNFLITIALLIATFIVALLTSGLAVVAGPVSILFMFFLSLFVLFMFVILFLGIPVIAFEKNNPIDAFGRVFKLSKGKWWSTFGLVVVVAIIGYIISMFFSLPRGILFGIEAFTNFQEGGDLDPLALMSNTDQALNILFSLFETFGQILLYSLVYIAVAFQYFNLVERRESRGLVAKIEQMDEAGGDEEANENY